MDETWFLWDTSVLVAHFVIAIAVWWACTKVDDFKKYNLDGYLLGTAICLVSWFSVGLWSLLALVLFNACVFLIDAKVVLRGD